jgi:hypothetical protein
MILESHMRQPSHLAMIVLLATTVVARLTGQATVVEVSPARASVTAGDTIRFHVTAKDSAGRVVTGAPVLWIAASFDVAGADSTGLVTTTRPGQSFVFALVDGTPGFAVLDVTERGPARLEIAAPEGGMDLVVGDLTRLEARAYTSVGDPLGTTDAHGVPGVQWRSLATGIAGVSPGGLVRALAPGRATIVATLGSLTARRDVSVHANPVVSLRITAPRESRVGDVVALQAAAQGSGGRAVTGARVRWSVTGRGASIDPDGRFVATEPGSYPITASAGNRVAFGEVQVLPRHDPRSVEQVAHLATPAGVQLGEIWVAGNAAYMSSIGSEIYVFDIRDPAKPVLTDSLVLDARLINDVMTTADGKILVASREGASNRRNGLVFFDCSDPLHPRPIAEFTETVTGGVHSAFVYQHYVFATDDATGSLRIIDFADPQHPRQIARWEVGPQRAVTAYPVEFLNVSPQRYLHDAYVENGLAYLAYWRDGLIILDVGNGVKGGSITNPTFVSQYAYNHAELYPPGYIAGTHAVFRAGNYVYLGDESYPAIADLASHEQFSTRGRMHVVDVSDLEHPLEVAYYEPIEFGVHNIYVQDGLAYIGAYNGGIRVVDVSGELRGDLRAQGRLVGSLYTGSLEGYRPNMALTWSAIPHAGYVYASDINSGFWVARVTGEATP